MDKPHEMVLRLSARQEDWLIARMALSGLGMLAGLDADLIGDLQTCRQRMLRLSSSSARHPRNIGTQRPRGKRPASVLLFRRRNSRAGPEDALDGEIARCVLETLLPEVRLETDERGVYSICGSLTE